MEAAEKISITLTAEMLRKVRQSVEAGEYASTSEVMRDALRAWSRERDEHERWLNDVRRRVRAAIEEPGEDLPADQAFAEVARLMEDGEAADDAP